MNDDKGERKRKRVESYKTPTGRVKMEGECSKPEMSGVNHPRYNGDRENGKTNERSKQTPEQNVRTQKTAEAATTRAPRGTGKIGVSSQTSNQV